MLALRPQKHAGIRVQYRAVVGVTVSLEVTRVYPILSLVFSPSTSVRLLSVLNKLRLGFLSNKRQGVYIVKVLTYVQDPR